MLKYSLPNDSEVIEKNIIDFYKPIVCLWIH